MMVGIIPMSRISVPSKLTIQFMLDRAQQRKIALGCTRCGGTGNFSTVDFVGTGSRFGSHCFSCGDAWKLPLKWSSFSSQDIARLFEEETEKTFIRDTIDTFMEVRMLNEEQANEVSDILGV